jgi:hypothetical protein
MRGEVKHDIVEAFIALHPAGHKALPALELVWK